MSTPTWRDIYRDPPTEDLTADVLAWTTSKGGRCILWAPVMLDAGLAERACHHNVTHWMPLPKHPNPTA